MTKQEALQFLEQNQPLPSDNELEKDMSVLDKYDIIRRFFIQNPARESIPLFLNSFGEGSGFGVYQLVEDVITQFSLEEVLPHLLSALNSNNRGVRYWATQIAVNFPAPALVEPLSNILEKDDEDTKYIAVAALRQIGGEKVKTVLSSQLKVERSESVKEIIQDSLDDLD